ncbi:MAG: response regulator transcription factor [Fusobacteriota bacterium]
MKAAIVEDQDSVRKLICEILKNEEFEVMEFDLGYDFIEQCDLNNVDLVILDIGLPDMDGLLLCKQIKKKRGENLTPIVYMVTAISDQTKVNEAFEYGAEGYLRKPFNLQEMRLRIKNIKKRVLIERSKEVKTEYKDIYVDRKNKVCYYNSRLIETTKMEYRLLLYLIDNRKKLLTRPKIMRNVWNKTFFPEDRSIDIYISKLKRKFPPIDINLKTVTGYGYRLLE